MIPANDAAAEKASLCLKAKLRQKGILVLLQALKSDSLAVKFDDKACSASMNAMMLNGAFKNELGY